MCFTCRSGLLVRLCQSVFHSLIAQLVFFFFFSSFSDAISLVSAHWARPLALDNSGNNNWPRPRVHLASERNSASERCKVARLFVASRLNCALMQMRRLQISSQATRAPFERVARSLGSKIFLTSSLSFCFHLSRPIAIRATHRRRPIMTSSRGCGRAGHPGARARDRWPRGAWDTNHPNEWAARCALEPSRSTG